MRQGNIQGYCTALFFQGYRTRGPQLVALPIDDDYDPACGCAPGVDDLIMAKWFGRCPETEWVHRFPGTDCRLGHSYHVCFAASPFTCARNRLIWRMFGIRWMGNVVVVKCSSREFGRVVHITRYEVRMVCALLER